MGREYIFKGIMERWLEAGTLTPRCRVGLLAPGGLCKAGWGNWLSNYKCPAINLLEFHEWGLWIAFCQWMDVFFQGGKCPGLEQSPFCMSLVKGHKVMVKMRLVGEHIGLRYKPWKWCRVFQEIPIPYLRFNLILEKRKKEPIYMTWTHSVPDTVLSIS